MQPHRSRYWLNAKADPRKVERILDICDVYARAMTHPEELVISVDEMTGIQALERIAEDLPMGRKKPLAREFEYRRHGTQTLIAGLNVATGTVVAQCGDTRTEEDFVAAIAHLLERHPGHTTYHFVADQLNTHQSEALVRFVAQRCGIEEDLGKKGHHGILQSMASRAEFLSRPDKAIVFHYTPKHASWMNQIEIWFAISARKVIRRGNFSSTNDLRTKVLDFIEYFNAKLAHPFRWTYTGEALCQ